MHGLGASKFAARQNLASISQTWLDRLSAEHVTWVVTEPDDAAINAILSLPRSKVEPYWWQSTGEFRVPSDSVIIGCQYAPAR